MCPDFSDVLACDEIQPSGVTVWSGCFSANYFSYFSGERFG
jgi:hypothetical protein